MICSHLDTRGVALAHPVETRKLEDGSYKALRQWKVLFIGRNSASSKHHLLVVSFDSKPLAQMQGVQTTTKSFVDFVFSEKFTGVRKKHQTSL
jgi:hypothetical protein